MKTWIQFGVVGFVLATLSGSGCPPTMPPQGEPMQPVGEPMQPQAVLALESNPTAIVMDAGRSLAYVGDGQRIRRINLEQRSYAPPISNDGVFYGLDPTDDLVGQIEPDSGQIRRFFAYPHGQAFPTAGHALGMTYDPTINKLYVLDVAAIGRPSTLFELDPNSGTRAQIGEPGMGAGLGTAFSLARDPNSGMLYTVDVTDNLWRIDPATGIAIQVSEFIGFTNIQGLAFAPDGVLWGFHATNEPNPLVTIDLATGVATERVRLPLSYTAGSLAFKPDGTLWTVDLVRDALIQIDPGNGQIIREFPTLERQIPPLFGTFFKAINGLVFASPGGGDPFVGGTREIASLGVAEDGGIVAAANDMVTGFDSELNLRDGGFETGGLKTFRTIVFNPQTGLAYVRDGHAGIVYEFLPDTLELVREIQYRQSVEFFSPPRDPGMALDPQTGRLFVVGDSRIHIVNLPDGTSADMNFDGSAEAVVVDSERRRLHVNALLGLEGTVGPECSSIRTLDLDTFETLSEICVGVQIFNMAFDPQRNRMAANARFLVETFDTRVFLFDMETLSQIAYDLMLESTENGEETSNTFNARLTIDPARNQLLVGLFGSDPRIEFFPLPE